MNIAIEGCLHGELDKVYTTILYIEQLHQIKIDLLLICGDFQSIRNKEDMYNMECPEKYMQIGNFWEYYSGIKKAPILTIFIGGNHEASNYLRELYFGGWVAPNIYYLGNSNIINVKKGENSLRIGGISGIFKYFDYKKGHFEMLPLNQKNKKSIYHVREYEIFKMSLVEKPLNIFLSHDWPNGIHKYGSAKYLIQKKPHFQNDINHNKLGNPGLMYLLQKLNINYWFSAHLHVKFYATFQTKEAQNNIKTTKFLSLDKCLPKRDFLQIITVNKPKSTQDIILESSQVLLEYDLEWLAIIKATINIMPLSYESPNFFNYIDFNNGIFEAIPLAEKFNLEKNNIKKDLEAKLDPSKLKIPLNFEQTKEAFNPQNPNDFKMLDKMAMNNQTRDFLNLLEINDHEKFKNFLFFDNEKLKETFNVKIKDKNDEEISLFESIEEENINNTDSKLTQINTLDLNSKSNPNNNIVESIQNIDLSLEKKYLIIDAETAPQKAQSDINIEELPFI